ncbi:MAG: transglycosylase domain-containing protein [Saprospiraceae bacterium]
MREVEIKAVIAFFKNKKLISIGIIFIIALLIIPIPRYSPHFSKSLYDIDGNLLSATVSDEGQWCFPLDSGIPEKLQKSIILYEDEYFYFHPGFNPVSIIKSIIIDIKNRRIVRGGSTITMQLMRMKNRNVSRNILNKFIETLSAVKYSLFHSKSSILKSWCEIAPFGSNVIGVKAASLKYFNRNIDQLSWSECALLAVMPNGPGYANINKNRTELLRKRDFLLHKIHDKGYISDDELVIYLSEDLPERTFDIEQKAYHYLKFLEKSFPDQNIFYSDINFNIQYQVNQIVQSESQNYQSDDIRNMAAIVLDVKENSVLAYIGNVLDGKNGFNYVDIIQSPRSYGSILKPLLYAFSIDNGYLLPRELVADIPTTIGDYRPENFDKKFRGAVHFDEVIIQSLNVPSVRVLNKVGLHNFYNQISKLDIKYLDKGADYYGLSIILGGGRAVFGK